jgi:hypothetical protein
MLAEVVILLLQRIVLKDMKDSFVRHVPMDIIEIALTNTLLATSVHPIRY